MDDESNKLADLIDSVADGGPIDWDAIERIATDAVLRRLMQELRTVAGVAAVHRSEIDGSEVDGSEEQPTAGTTREGADGVVGQWGHFQLVRKIGEGSFGEVYHARDTWLDHDVALKLVKQQLVDRSRFLHEARTLAQIRHPNVVAIHGGDVHDGRLGFWMELIQGHTLADVVAREGVRSAGEAAVLGQDLCRAIAAVHATKIVHRDIKAQNVMRQSGTGRIVLMDFGAGEAMQAPRGSGFRLTGTPLYLAPELFNLSPATVQTDIYALGVLLFYVVTQSFPVQGNSMDELVVAHKKGERRHLGDVRPDLPDAFVRVVETMLASVPSQRYLTATSARAALEAVVVPSMPHAIVPGTGSSSNSSTAQGRRLMLAASIVTLVFAFIAVMGLVSTAAFNLTFGRSGFASESPFQLSAPVIGSVVTWFVWGARSLVSPGVRIMMALMAVTLMVAAARVFCRLFPRAGEAALGVRRICHEFAHARQLDDANLLLQVVAGIGALGFALIGLTFWQDATIFATYINDAPTEQLSVLQPANGPHYDVYARLLELGLFLYGLVAYVVYSTARRSHARVHPAVTAGVVAVPALALVLMRELPYRIVYQNEFGRVDLQNTRCYEIGRRPGEVLLHCPDVVPPRNQVVSDADPRLRPRGVVESVFTPREQSRR